MALLSIINITQSIFINIVYNYDTVLFQNETFKYLVNYYKNKMEKTLFVKFLGDSPKIRVLDMLITGRELDYSISDIAEQAGIGRATFYRMIDELLKNKIILPTRKFGNIQLYKINLNNEFVKGLVKLYDHITKVASEKEIKKQRLVLAQG